MNIFLIVAYALMFFFLFVYVPVQVYRRKKAGKVKKMTTYSYKSLLYHSIKDLPIVLFIISVIYIVSRDIEVTISLGAFILACYFVMCLKMLFWEYQAKRSGGKEKNWEEED